MSGAALRFFKQNKNAINPTYGTRFAACFDISACLKDVEKVTAYTKDNQKVEIPVVDDAITIEPGMRALIPTGLIFELPRYYSLRVHPRSGLSVKNGVTLVNCEGVIDPDYVDPTFLTLFNVSDVPFVVAHGDRAAQGELVPTENNVTVFHELPYAPKKIGDRNGGFGSTGV